MDNIEMTDRERKYLDFKRNHKLDEHICEIPWDLREGPTKIWESPSGRKIMNLDEYIDYRDDALWPFTDICMLFDGILEIHEIVEFLISFSKHAENYDSFLKIIRYLSSIENEVGDDATSIKTYLYFTSLNGLIKKPPNVFDYIIKKSKNSFTRTDLKDLKKNFENEHSIGRKYEMFFKEYLSDEAKELLLSKIHFAEITSNINYKVLDLDSGKMAKKFYKVMRCEIAHGASIMPLTYDPETSFLKNFMVNYTENNKKMVMFSEMPISEWKNIILRIISKYFEEQNFL